MNLTAKNRIFYLDLLRTIGCLAVVLLHTAARFTLEPCDSLNYLIGAFFDGLSQFAVPLFVMISGSLYLNEDYTLTAKKLFSHVKRVTLFFFGWSTIYCLIFTVCKNILTGAPLTVLTIITAVWNGPFHLWFIPMIIGLYIITPFLRLWIKKDNQTYIQYFLLLGFLFNFIIPLIEYFVSSFFPELSVFSDLDSALYFYYGSGYVFYFVLGWYLHQFDLPNKKRFYCLGILGLIFSVMGTVAFARIGISSGYFFNNFSIFVLAYSISIFTFIKSFFYHRKTSSRFVDLICRHNMGIYAMHMGVFPLFTYVLKIQHAALAIPACFIASTILPLIATVIINKIKFLHFLV